jgi:hypothetical protein
MLAKVAHGLLAEADRDADCSKAEAFGVEFPHGVG